MYENAVEYLQNHLEDLTAVYLFGSQATNTHSASSDVDFAFLAKDGLSSEELFELKQGLEFLLKVDVDLVNLKEASTVIRVQVLQADKVLYCSDEVQRAYFEMYALSDYARLNRERAGILEDFYSGN